MSEEIATRVLSKPQPRGLKRFILLLLAQAATDGGQLAFGEADQQRLASLAAMRLDRFSSKVEELRFEGFVSLDGGVMTLYDGGPTGGSDSDQTSLLQGPTSVSGRGSVKGSVPSQNAGSAVQRVLDAYCEVFGVQGKWGEDDRREVRAALQVASVEEVEEAIKGNRASAFHQGENDQRKKYNTLGHIIRGKRGKRTRRENIDFFRDLWRKAQATTGGSVKAVGADPAIVASRKEEVRRAHRLAHDQEAQERGRRAEAWLCDHGIETQRRPDGYPIWPEGAA